MTERVTLKPGDYVAMCDIMNQSQYEEIGESFVAAGCRSQHWEEHSKEDFGKYDAVGWDSEDDVLCTDSPQHDTVMPSNVRRLTPSQVLTATNAGGQTQDTLTTILESAAEHDAKAKHHATEHERLMQQARDMLPDGWMLVRGGVDWAEGQDMSDPANWREGDVVECTRTMVTSTKGNLYELQDRGDGVVDEDGDAVIKADDEGDEGYLPRGTFRWHHRPT